MNGPQRLDSLRRVKNYPSLTSSSKRWIDERIKQWLSGTIAIVDGGAVRLNHPNTRASRMVCEEYY